MCLLRHLLEKNGLTANLFSMPLSRALKIARWFLHKTVNTLGTGYVSTRVGSQTNSLGALRLPFRHSSNAIYLICIITVRNRIVQ